MDKKTVIERAKRYSELARKNFPVKKVILYGSYARGTQKTHSDIDVAVVLDHVEDDFLTAETRLYQLRRQIDVRIEPVLLEKINDKSGFLEEILKTGEIIYSSD